MENAIQTVGGGNLAPLAEIERAADYISKSGMFGVKTKEQAAALMLVAQSEGLHYARAAMSYDIIFGRPALKSSEVLSRFQSAGGKINYRRSDSEACTVELSHPQGGTMTVTWDLERAKRAGLWDKKDSLWPRYPEQMLRARAVSEGVRALFPACLNGFYAVEEVQDFDAPKKPPLDDAPSPPPPSPPPGASAQEAEVVLPNPSKAPKAAAGMTESEADALCGFLSGLTDRNKTMQIVGKYCDPKMVRTLGKAQASKLVDELSNGCDPGIFGEGA